MDKLYFAFTQEALADLAENKSSAEEEFEFNFTNERYKKRSLWTGSEEEEKKRVQRPLRVRTSEGKERRAGGGSIEKSRVRRVGTGREEVGEDKGERPVCSPPASRPDKEEVSLNFHNNGQR